MSVKENPLTKFPAGPNPTSVEALDKNLVECRKRYRAAIKQRDEAWARVMEIAATGMKQQVVSARNEAERHSQIAIRLKVLGVKWAGQREDLINPPAGLPLGQA